MQSDNTPNSDAEGVWALLAHPAESTTRDSPDTVEAPRTLLERELSDVMRTAKASLSHEFSSISKEVLARSKRKFVTDVSIELRTHMREAKRHATRSAAATEGSHPRDSNDAVGEA